MDEAQDAGEGVIGVRSSAALGYPSGSDRRCSAEPARASTPTASRRRTTTSPTANSPSTNPCGSGPTTSPKAKTPSSTPHFAGPTARPRKSPSTRRRHRARRGLAREQPATTCGYAASHQAARARRSQTPPALPRRSGHLGRLSADACCGRGPSARSRGRLTLASAGQSRRDVSVRRDDCGSSMPVV
jgi:hypothetical protein